jgi:hypothetical protein
MLQAAISQGSSQIHSWSYLLVPLLALLMNTREDHSSLLDLKSKLSLLWCFDTHVKTKEYFGSSL